MVDMKKIQEMMMNSIFDVYEKMFFVFLEPVDEDIRYDMTASIRFTGPLQGELTAFISERMAVSMVENMLGLEKQEVTHKQMEDCAKESINMICGHFLNKLDPSKVFDLSIPEYEKRAGVFKKEDQATLNIAFDSDGDMLGVSMTIAQGKKH